MATEKTYSVVGTTIQPDGIMKIRWTNNIMRIKILHREGHTDIRLTDLGREMDKYAAVKVLQGLDEFQDSAAQSVIADYLDEKAPTEAKRPAVSTTADADTQTA